MILMILVNTLALTKPEKAAIVENTIINMTRTGQIINKFGEDQLIGLLEKISEQTQKKTVVKVKKVEQYLYLIKFLVP